MAVIERVRLDSLLDLVADVRVAEVTGSAGSGKTTALRAWASRTSIGDVVTLTVRSEHRDPRVLRREFEDVLAPDRDAGPPSATALADACDQAVSRSGRRLVVVVDEAERLVDAESVEVLRELIGCNVDALRVVLCGREIPEIGLEPLRRQGALATVSERDLRLTRAETAEIVRSVSGIEVDDRLVMALHQQIGGWPLGATLAGLVLRTADPMTFDTVAGIEHHRYFDQYFGNEVFGLMSQETQDFLLDTCVLDDMEPDQCHELTGRADAELVLRDLERANVFTHWAGGRTPVFRYHQMLRSWLRHRLESTDAPRATSRRRQAASWCAAHGRHAEAIEYLIAAGELEQATDAVIAYGPTALSEGRYEALKRWIEALPKDDVASSASLLMLLAEAAHRSGDALATSSVRALEAGLIARGDETESDLELSVIVQRGRELNAAGRFAAAAAEARRAIGLIDVDAPPIAGRELSFDEVAIATQVSSIAAQLMFDGDWAESARLEKWVVGTFPADSVAAAPARVSCLGKLAIGELWHNARPAAASVAHEAIALCRFHGIDPIDIGFAEMVLLVAEPGPDTAEIHAQLERRSEQMRLPSHTSICWLLRAWSYILTDQPAEAETTFAEAVQIISSLEEPGVLASFMRRVGAIVETGVDQPVLGAREFDVLRALAEGKSRREVAASMNLSLNTIKWYARRAYRALGATTLEEAVARCAAFGIALEAEPAGARAFRGSLPS